MRTPPVYFYRDRDGREIDLVFSQDGALHGVEAKRGASPRPEWRRPFAALGRFPGPAGSHAVVCLAPDELPLDRATTVVPVGYL